MDRERFDPIVHLVLSRTNLPEDALAERLVVAATTTLAERLPRALATRVAAHLPEPLASAAREAKHGQHFDVEALHVRLADRAGLSQGVAREVAPAVMTTLAGALPDPPRAELLAALPPAMQALLTATMAPRPAFWRPPPPPRPGNSTLASGRPGSQRSIATARPERAHTHSVAASDDPHGKETLASGRPGSDRPLWNGRR